MPVIAFAHSYGPIDDVARAPRSRAQATAPAWINRYGYLSDAKFSMLREMRRGR